MNFCPVSNKNSQEACRMNKGIMTENWGIIYAAW